MEERNGAVEHGKKEEVKREKKEEKEKDEKEQRERHKRNRGYAPTIITICAERPKEFKCLSARTN